MFADSAGAAAALQVRAATVAAVYRQQLRCVYPVRASIFHADSKGQQTRREGVEVSA